jgi:hypothetical protein
MSISRLNEVRTGAARFAEPWASMLPRDRFRL